MINFKSKWTWTCVVITVIILIFLGTIFHNAYAYNPEFKPIGYITPTSESVWEHLKLVYTPCLLIFLFYYPVFLRYYNNLWTAFFASILLGCAFIIVAYYTYSGVWGSDYVVIDIIIYILAIIISVWLFLYMIRRNRYNILLAGVIILLGISLGIALVIFSYGPPPLGIFKSNVA